MREEKMEKKMAEIERKQRNSRRRLLGSVQEMKDRETHRLEVLNQNRQGITREIQKRNANITDRPDKEQGMPKSARMSRAQSHYSSVRDGPEDKVRLVQSEAQRLVAARQKEFDQRMAAFNERMKEKQRVLDEKREQRQEQARQWSLTLKFNVSKKMKKECYRKRLLQQKIRSIDTKQRAFEENKKAIMAERFYTKINDEMKNFYVKEALEEMALTKNWSIVKLDMILTMFQPKLQEGLVKDKKAIQQNINKVLTDPFHQARTLLIDTDNGRPEEEPQHVELVATVAAGGEHGRDAVAGRIIL